MQASIEQLEHNLEFLAHLISTRDEGETYLPLYAKLEAEINRLQSQREQVAKIKLRAANFSCHQAA